MKRHRLSNLARFGLLSAGLAAASMGNAQTTNWIAFNDHARAAGTGANVEAYSLATSGAAIGGPLTNFLTGGLTGAGLQISGAGGTINGVTGSSTAPTAGTPADQIFSPQIAWLDSALYFGPSPYTAGITYTFTNLNPAARYVFRGTAVRGNSYPRRWSMATLVGAASSVPGHIQGSPSPGIVTNGWSPYGNALTPNLQVAWNTGENRGGDVVGWNDIVPAADGTFSVICSNYGAAFTGTLPGATGGVDNYCYAFAALMIAEVQNSVIAPVTNADITKPADISVGQNQSGSMTMVATGNPLPQYQWYRGSYASHTALGGKIAATLTFTGAQAADEGDYFAVAYNSVNSVTSRVAHLTVVPDHVAPYMVKCVATPETNSTGDGFTANYELVLTFSEPVDAGSALNTAHYSVETTGGSGNVLFVNTAVMIDPSTVLLTIADPLSAGYFNYSVITWCGDGAPCDDAIKDLAGNPVADQSSLPVFWNLPLIPAPAYDQTVWDWDDGQAPGKDGTDWKTYGDTTTWKTGLAQFVGDTGTSLDSGSLPGFTAAANRTTTVLSSAANVTGAANTGPITTYFRRKFYMPPASPDAITLNMRQVLDDGAVFYVNGSEILRVGIGSTVVVTNGTFATSATESGNVHPVGSNPNLSTTALVLDGENAFAVELHQVNASSSDTLMGVELMAYITNFATGPAMVTVQPVASTNVLEGQPFTLKASVSGALPLSYQWYLNGNPIAGATSLSYTVAAATPANAGTYHMTVNNGLGGDSTANAVVTITGDTTPPTVVSVVGSSWRVDGAASIIATVSEPLDPASVTVGKFIVKAGTTVLPTLAVALQSPTVVVITTDARVAGVNYALWIEGVTDNSYGKNALYANVPVVAQYDMVHMDDTNHVWSYNDTGADLGEFWAQTTHIGQWATGLQTFDSKSGSTTNRATVGTATIGTFMNLLYNTVVDGTNLAVNVNTYYFQTAFNWPGTTNTATLQIHRILDDGAAFFINGVRFFATNYPTGPWSVTNQVGMVSAGTGVVFPATNVAGTTVTVSNLVHGENILSVEMRQQGATSSDATMGVSLLAEVPDWGAAAAQNPKLAIVQTPEGNIVVSWAPGGGTLMSAPSPIGPWTAIGGANPYTTTAADAAKFFKLSN